MPLPGHPVSCPHPIPTVEDLKIRFPGGTTLQIPAAPLANPGDEVARLLGLLSAAFAPLMPLLDIVDAFLTVVKVFEAVKSLNPISIGNALVDLVKQVDKLRSLLPPVAGPALVKDIVHAVRLYVEDMARQLAALEAQQARILLVAERAVESPSLTPHVVCAQATVDVSFASMKQGAAPVNRIVRLVNLVGAIAGLPALPSLELGANPAAARQALQTLAEALLTLESAIPG